MRDAIKNSGMHLLLILGLCLGSSNAAFAATYWVSPTGVAASEDCSGPLPPLNGSTACSRVTALANAAAGDTVYFRAGSSGGYVLTANWSSGIAPANTGASVSAKITFADVT